MANKEIPELPPADELNGTEVIHIVQGGNSRKGTLAEIPALGLIDEDDFATDSETKSPSQQSTKAYIASRDARLLHVRDQKATNTNGGSSSAATQVRVLNTVVVNGIVGASLSSNVITLPAGVYEICAKVPNYAGSKHAAHLRVNGAGTLVREGTPELSGAAAQTSSMICGRFTLGSSSNLEIAHKITSGQASDGLGVAANVSGVPEVYTDVLIWKVD